MFIIISLTIICLISFKLLNPIFNSKEVIITYGFKKYNIVTEYPKIWYYFKITYICTFIFSNIIYLNYLYNKISKVFSKRRIKKEKFIIKSNKINLLIGNDEETGKNIYIQESGLYQNFLITGTI